MTNEPDKRYALEPMQQELFGAIAKHRSDIAECYRAAVVILNDDGVPDRLPLAAHALRELMEKLPAKEMVVDMNADINAKVNALQKPWKDAVDEDRATGLNTWAGRIGPNLRAFLTAMEEFFRNRAAIGSGRAQQTATFLYSLEVSRMRLPEDVQRRNTKQWMDLRQYFNAVSHHNQRSSDADFRHRVSQLESFLQARLIPQPSADFAVIDALLKED